MYFKIYRTSTKKQQDKQQQTEAKNAESVATVEIKEKGLNSSDDDTTR